MSGSSSSSPAQFDSAGALAHISNLEAQLASATAQLTQANAEGNRVVSLLNAEKAKLQQQVTANSRINVKVPVVQQFKGEVGFSIDTWLRRLQKQFEFYGPAVFPSEDSRIRYAVMHLEGAAMDWWDKILQSDKDKIVTWDLFVEALHSRFRPMQASHVARLRLSTLKQTGTVSAYVNVFQRELTPITDMGTADQIFFFRQGLKPYIAQRVLEKVPKTLHEAMDIAILADAHTSKTGTGVASHFYQSRNGNGLSSSNRHATTGPSDMDLSAINHDEIKAPTFHEEESSSSSPGQTDMIREFNRMKSELKKVQTEAAIIVIVIACASIEGGIRVLFQESSVSEV
jgi:hypothetical protein